MEFLMLQHRFEYQVSFGDCDPAGIVFYPNNFSWFDRTFHNWLDEFGGHDGICRRLNAVGIGLMDASARFQAPLRPGDRISILLSVTEWKSRSVSLHYEVLVGERIAIVGHEVRGLFTKEGSGIIAGDMNSFRTLVERGE